MYCTCWFILVAVTTAAGLDDRQKSSTPATMTEAGSLDLATTYRLQRAFASLDFDEDGHVTFDEATLGLLSSSERRATHFSGPVQSPYVFGERQCSDPTLDALSFVECTVAYARRLQFSKEKSKVGMAWSFKSAMQEFLSGCSVQSECWLRGFGSCSQCAGEERKTNQLFHEESNGTCSAYTMLNQTDIDGDNIGGHHSGVKSLDACCQLCGRETSCGGFTWRKDQNKCYLKSENSSSAKHIANKHAFSGIVTTPRPVPSPSPLPSPSPSPAPVPPGAVKILLSSDWHVEPWYAADGHCSNHKEGKVCRFAKASLNNMFQCRHGEINGSCTLLGDKDPPIEMEESHIASPGATDASLHFFLGDTQAHGWTWLGNPPNSQAPATITKMMTRVLGHEIEHFRGAENVVWTAGNNDGPHDAAFHKQDPATIAWADTLLQSNIVTDSPDLNITYSQNRNTTALFRDTGFYAKPLPLLGPSAFAVVLNTNLGGDNKEMKAAVNTTLSWINDHHGNNSIVYLLGHHPAVMGKGVECGYVPDHYRSLIKGVFAGHVHTAKATDASLFTQVPAITQEAKVTGYWVATVSPSQPELRVSGSDLFKYNNNPGHLPPNASHWVRM